MPNKLITPDQFVKAVVEAISLAEVEAGIGKDELKKAWVSEFCGRKDSGTNT